MEVFVCVRTVGRQIDFGVATTGAERSAIQARRFRVYQGRGYYRPGLTVDRDEYDEKAVYVLAVLDSNQPGGEVVGSARFIVGEPYVLFRFPCEEAFQLEPPEDLREIPAGQCGEVGRMVSERPEGIVLGRLVVPLGLIQAVSEYSQRHDIRCGLAIIKQRFLRALTGAGVRFREFPSARLIYPSDGVASPYFYRHADPVVPIYWLADEIAPSIERAITRYQGGALFSLD